MSASQKLWLWAIIALTKEITLRIGRFRRFWIGQTAMLSLRFKDS